MSRKSSLSPEQWADVGRRLLEGETPGAIARDFTAKGVKMSESTVRSHFDRNGQKTKTIQQVAGMLFDADAAAKAADEALKTLPAAAQASAVILANKMRSISEKLACAAESSAATAMRLSAIANSEAQKVDDASPLQNAEALKNTVLLTKAANEAAHIPLNLLSANKDAVRRFVDEPPPADDLTPERLQEGARRIAFMLHRAAAKETS